MLTKKNAIIFLDLQSSIWVVFLKSQSKFVFHPCEGIKMKKRKLLSWAFPEAFHLFYRNNQSKNLDVDGGYCIRTVW